MQETTAKVIDLNLYKELKEKQSSPTVSPEDEKDDELPSRPYYTITMPSQYEQQYIIPDKYKRAWNKMWAVGFTIMILSSLLL